MGSSSHGDIPRPDGSRPIPFSPEHGKQQEQQAKDDLPSEDRIEVDVRPASTPRPGAADDPVLLWRSKRRNFEVSLKAEGLIPSVGTLHLFDGANTPDQVVDVLYDQLRLLCELRSLFSKPQEEGDSHEL